MAGRPHPRTFGTLLALCALTTAVYLPLWGMGPVYEDVHWLSRVHVEQLVIPGRALAIWSLEQSSSHLTQTALHVVNGVAIYLVTRRLVPSAALVAAGIWLLHPLNSAAASYLTARTDLLMTLGTLLALLGALIQPTRRIARYGRWGLVCVGLLVAATSKEMGLVAIPLVWMTSFMWRTDDRAIRWGLSLAAVSALVVTAPQLALYFALPVSQQGSAWDWPTWLSLQLMATWHLLALVPPSSLWIDGFSIDHDVLSLGPMAWLWACLLTVQAGAVLLIRIPAVSWTVLWVAVAMVPRFLFRTSEVITEPQMALPMVGIVIGAAAGVSALWAWSAPKRAIYV